MNYISVFIAGMMFTTAVWQAVERKWGKAAVSIGMMAANIAVAIWVSQ